MSPKAAYNLSARDYKHFDDDDNNRDVLIHLGTRLICTQSNSQQYKNNQ